MEVFDFSVKMEKMNSNESERKMQMKQDGREKMMREDTKQFKGKM